MFVCLCMHYTVHCLSRLPLDTFPPNFILGTFLKICQENENLVPVGQNIGHFTWRRSIFYCCWRQGLSSSEMVSGCWDSRGANKIVWTRRIVTLCVHCVHCFKRPQSLVTSKRIRYPVCTTYTSVSQMRT